MFERDKSLEAQIKRCSKRLGDLIGQYQRQTGMRLSIFAHGGEACIIDSQGDSDRVQKMSLDAGRSAMIEDGGIVVLHMPAGDTAWSGGAW